MSATNYGQFWPTGWTTDTVLNATNVGSGTSGGTSSPSNAISNSALSPNEVLDTECHMTVVFGSTYVAGVTVYILRQTSTGYQSTSDPAYSFTIAGGASTTVNQVFTIPGSEVGGFKIAVQNPSGNSVCTVTLAWRQSNGQFG